MACARPRIFTATARLPTATQHAYIDMLARFPAIEDVAATGYLACTAFLPFFAARRVLGFNAQCAMALFTQLAK